MGKMEIIRCPIEGLYIIEPKVHGDERGYFCETYNERDMFASGLDMRFVQDNESMSAKGVLRGLHFQKKFPQGKLVRVLQGRVYDVAVDIRPGSPTFGQYAGVELSDENHRQFYISPGFAHGYLSLTERSVFAYKVTEFYHPEDEDGIAWNDPSIGVKWPEIVSDESTDCGYRMQDGTPLIINERDRSWQTWVDYQEKNPID